MDLFVSELGKQLRSCIFFPERSVDMDLVSAEESAAVTAVATWQFQSGLEKRQIAAQDMITLHKRALYELAKIERDLPVWHKKQQDMERLAETEDVYKLLAEQHKAKLVELLSKRDKYEEQAKQMEEEKCLAELRLYNNYMVAAKEFLQKHRYLHNMVELKHVVDKKAMENLVTELFRKAMAQYETYESLKSNWMYKMLPFTRPWNYDEHMQEQQLALLQKVRRLQTIVHYFPEMQARLDHERAQAIGFPKVAKAIQGWVERASSAEPMEKDKKFLRDIRAIRAEVEDMMQQTKATTPQLQLFAAVLGQVEAVEEPLTR